LAEIKKSTNWNAIYKELFMHQDLMELFMDAMLKNTMELSVFKQQK
jgi:hypothetical protein